MAGAGPLVAFQLWCAYGCIAAATLPVRGKPRICSLDLLTGLAKKLGPHSMQHFGPGSKLNQRILRKIIEVYTSPEGLGELGLIEATDKDHFRRMAPKALGPWKSEAALEKAYLKASKK